MNASNIEYEEAPSGKYKYSTIHQWVIKHWGRANKCEECGRRRAPIGARKHWFEWANLDGKYSRKRRESWKQLCIPCHRRLDGNFKHPKGEQHPMAKLTQIQVDEIRARYKFRVVTARMLATEFGVARETVTEIVNGNRWKI